MRKREYSLFIIFICMFLFFICGCMILRSYVSAEKGFINLRLKKQFGEGKQLQEYFITRDKIINKGDNVSYLVKILGYPDEVNISLSGYNIWAYKKKNVTFYIVDNRVEYIYKR